MGLQGFQRFYQWFCRFAFDFAEFASNVGSVTIWLGLTIFDLTRLVQNYDDFRKQVGSFSSWIILGIRAYDTSSNFSRWSLPISRKGFSQRFLIHSTELTSVSYQVSRQRFRLANWDGANASDFIDILHWHFEWFVSWSLWDDNFKHVINLDGWNVGWVASIQSFLNIRWLTSFRVLICPLINLNIHLFNTDDHFFDTQRSA